MLAAFYHPQNLYCMAVDADAPDLFKETLLGLRFCFPNIMVSVRLYSSEVGERERKERGERERQREK